MDVRPYEIEIDAERRLITIGFDQVFWDMDVADRFTADIVGGLAQLRCAPGSHFVLVDLRKAVLQGKEIFDKMQALVGSSTASRIALVASAPLARMQTKRLQIRENVVMFADLDEAQGWLFSGECARAAA